MKTVRILLNYRKGNLAVPFKQKGDQPGPRYADIADMSGTKKKTT